MTDQILDDNIEELEDIRNLKTAGFWIRVGASLLDILVLLPIIGFTMYNMFSLKSLALQLIFTVLSILYKPWMESQFGATVGKMIVGIKVIDLDYNKIDFKTAIIRFTPWLFGQAISLYSTILLFQHEDFIDTEGFLAISQLQGQMLPTSVNMMGSVILFISCVFVAFNNKNQGLHDMIADTYCVYK